MMEIIGVWPQTSTWWPEPQVVIEWPDQEMLRFEFHVSFIYVPVKHYDCSGT